MSGSDETGEQPGDAPSTPAERRALLINSVFAILLGLGITVLLHEVGHWVTGAAMGHRAFLFQASVTYEPPFDGAQAATTALAGPLLSLILGGVMQVIQPFRFRGGFLHLLWVWVACSSLMEFVTYLVITPLAGDTYNAAAALQLPTWVSFIAMAIGIAGMFAVARAFATHAVRHAGHDLKALRSFCVWPWLIAVVIRVGLNVLIPGTGTVDVPAAERVILLTAAIAQSVFAPMAMTFTRRVRELQEPLLLKPVPWGGIAAFVAFTLFTTFVTNGLPLGG